MCGIIGYKGKKNATKIVLEGLKILEYRGYDSWGLAIKNSKIKIKKKVGKISEMNEILPKSNIAIGHTRWATHGKVNIKNAHPHTDCKNNIALVHNGIIENYQELKNELKNHTFKSETDSEIIAHLIEENLKNNDFITAIKLTLKKIKGRFALIVIKKDENKLIATRRGSPLIIGKEKDGYFVASDIPAFLKHTNKIYFINDNDLIILNKNIKRINFITNKELPIKFEKTNLNYEQAKKGKYKHFMIKEILEQKTTLKQTLNQNKTKINAIAKEINKAKNIFFVGCGTAYHASLIGSYLFSQITNKQINVMIGSEFKNFKNLLKKDSIVIAISQSGETADVLEAIKISKSKKAKIYSILNVKNSSLARESDDYLLINVGPEIAVASTKAFTSQITLLTLLAFACSKKYDKGKYELNKTIKQINKFLNKKLIIDIKNLTKKINNKPIFSIGRSLNYPIAIESALKIKEVSYIHAEGFAGGELKHGPIALIEDKTPCLVFANPMNKEIISNAIEIKSRGGYLIGISPKYNEIFDYHIKVPENKITYPIINIIPIQILAYFLALKKGLNPDKPRNLAKSVTVI